DEAREAGIVQDVAAGHWLWPRFNGELLPDKPVLYHWLAALPCAAAGFSETAVRLPSALAGAALVAWTAALGADLLGAPAALAVLGLGWYAAALAGWGREFVHAHLVGRYLRNLAGGLAAGGAYSPKPLAYHLLFYAKHLPAIALPWTPFAVLALWQAWRTGGFRDPRLRFLVCWAAAPVVAFTPAEWKLRYYLL